MQNQYCNTSLADLAKMSFSINHHIKTSCKLIDINTLGVYNIFIKAIMASYPNQ